MKKKILLENLNNNIGQYININKIIFKKNTKFQNILILKNKNIGKILLLNKIIQTTEYDEFIYHEMICLIPLLSNPNTKKILIIGGGDGGCLKQLIKFNNIKKITLVEIDKEIIKCSKKYLYKIHNNSFNDKRIKIIINNGLNFLEKNKKHFDLIIIDGTDPIGEGKKLFTKKFYYLCKINLKKNGIFVTQNGTYIQKKYIINNYKIFKKIFKYSGFYLANIPTYYGGSMFFLWGSNDNNIKNIKKKNIIKLTKNLKFKYYNYSIHKNSFYLPQNIKEQIK